MSERESFEAWLTKRWAGDRDGFTLNSDGAYFLGSVQFAWEAWQAARAQPAQAGQMLTDAEIKGIGGLSMDSPYFGIGFDFARAIEAAVLAKRAPMTGAQIEHALRAEPMVDNEESFARGVRAAERHHGIVGKEGA